MTENTETLKNKQKRGIIITIAALVGVMVLVILLFLNKMTSPRVLSASELRINGAIIFENPRIIDPVSLEYHTGEVFNVDSLKDQWTLIFFGFTFCPDICPNTLAKLADAYKQLEPETRKQIKVVMVSVDPARDSKEQLNNYVPFFHPDFLGVTGDFVEMMKLTQNMNAAFTKVPMGDTYTIDHTANVAIVNPQGHYHGFLRPPFKIAKLKLILNSIVNH